ncbi:MAG TPA: ABC transporter permease, partial [Rhodobacteraceae bacterium]|nr:ABC transporter permease [Paracoccaceae bacterium]
MTESVQISKPPRSQWWDVWDQFRHHKGAMISSFVFIMILVIVIFGNLIWNIDPAYNDFGAMDQRPSLAHPLGTDGLGRDALAQMIQGGRTSIAVGITAMLLSLFLGTLVGVVAGYFKKLDGLLMRLTDLFLALPLLPLLLVMMMLFREPLSATFGPETGIFILMVSA